MARVFTFPVKPPLPTPSSLWFHEAAGGSQSSNPMCESPVGVKKLLTRQKGVETLTAPKPRPIVRGVSTDMAVEMVRLGVWNWTKLAHVAGAAAHAEMPPKDITVTRTLAKAAERTLDFIYLFASRQ